MRAPADLDSREFFERARERLTLNIPAGLTDASFTPKMGDHGIDATMLEIAKVRPIRPAAVLIAVIDHAEPTVLFTQRSAHLPNHAGQISFPGGKIDPGDKDPLDAALREAEEEIGLDRALVKPIGYLDLYMTTQGFRIVPTLARLEPGFKLTLNQDEVDDTFEVPLSFLMAPGNHKTISRDWQGMKRTVYSMPFGERHIWGVTAGILKNLHERIYK